METPCLPVERRSANYKPTLWNHNFIQSITEDGKVGDIKETRKLKEEVREMIYGEKLLKDKLDLIDSLQQLGVAYHFKKDIKCVLTEIHESMDQILMSTRDDLHLISLLFRLLRMHGFSVSEADILKNCMDNKDDFKAKLSSDIKATLSLYEASFLAKEGEEKLEMARNVTTKYLTDFLQSSKNTDSRLKEHVAHALELPLYGRGTERLHARWFIDQYKLYEYMRPAFMELAVSEFNLLQNAYKKELKETSRWWSDLQIHEKLPFVRDRLVENYLWSVAFVPELKHASLRKVLTKSIGLISTIDDVYDVYGSLDELEAFTHAVEQWDITSIEMLPEYMQFCLRALINMVHDDSDHFLKERGLNITPCLRMAWTELCKSYLVEARWYHTKYQPTLEEYLENGCVSITLNLVFTIAYCINDEVTANDLEQLLQGYPNITRHAGIASRLLDDFGTSTTEMERGDVDKAIQCYMRDKRVTESAARQGINEMIWKCWKLMNTENVGDSAFHEYCRNVLFNIVRMAQCYYGSGVDGYGDPGHKTKERVISLLLKPIDI
ncbi:monoterpene synthase 7, chloroplastic-like isoform X2 [Carex rostrata]